MKFKPAWIALLLVCLTSTVLGRTFYVTKTGSDSNAGTSWSTAWATVARVNSNIARGDTVRFGSGKWYHSQIIPPTGGDASHRTVYACSTFSTASQGLTTITSGDSVSGWTVYSGNIYRAAWTRPSGISMGADTGTRVPVLVMRDTLLFNQSSLGNVSAAGQFYHDGTYFYLWCYGGSPVGREILAAGGPTVLINNSSQNYVTFWGLNIHMGKQGVVEFNAHVNNVIFAHCDFAYGSEFNGNNPCLIWSGLSTTVTAYDNSFIACTFHDVAHEDQPDFIPGDTHIGAAAIIYAQTHMVFDSCSFFRIPGDGIHWKAAYATNLGNTVKNSRFIGSVANFPIMPGGGTQYYFMNSGVDIGERSGTDSVYGCYFSNIDNVAIQLGEVGSNPSLQVNQGRNFIANNTFYNVGIFILAYGTIPADTQYVKYNVGSGLHGANDGTYTVTFGSPAVPLAGADDERAFFTKVDSNYWFDDSAVNGYCHGASRNWTTWRNTYGYDTHSFNVDPGFTNPANLDFSRNSSSQEMVLNYGGRTWTRFGAWQPDGPPSVYQFVTDVATTNTVTLTDDLSGGTAPYDSLILHWSTNKANVLGLNARDTRATQVTDPYAFIKTSLEMSTKYYFRILGFDAGVDGDTTAIDSVTTLGPPAVDQALSESATINSVTIVDDLSGGTVPYDSLVLYWSTTRANVVNLSARDIRVTGANDPYTFSKTSLTSGTKYYYRVIASDLGAISDTSAIDSVTTLIPDVTPPTISAVSATNLSSTSAVIVWTTNETATSQVEYGYTTSYGQITTLDQTLVLSHSVGLSNLQRDTLYHYRVRSRDASGNEAIGTDNYFRTLNLDDISINVPDSVSGTYPGYSQVPVNDGILNPRGGTSTTWASDESQSNPHWITLYFTTPKVVQRTRMAWAWNGGSASWMCSRQYIIQYWDAGSNSYINAAVVNNTSADSLTVTDFAPVVTTRLRYWQPANMGPSNYPAILWITEFTVYGRDANGDIIAPAGIQDLNAIPSEGNGDILLSWTAPSDNGGLDDVSYYDIRYSPGLIDDLNWDNAEVIPNTPAPLSRGERQEFVVSELGPGEIYYIAIKSYDEAANASSLSNVPFSFASGIVPPDPASTMPDSSSGLVVVSCEAVNSYYSLYYQFQLDTSLDFVAPRTEVAMLSDSLASATFDQIIPNIAYFWRCRAIASTNADTSEWSNVTNFNLYTGVGSLLTEDDCISPAPGDVVQTNRPVFTVRRIDIVNSIYIQVDDNIVFNSPQSSGEISTTENYASWQLEQPLGNPGLYFWRVSTDNQNWTEPLSFTAVLDIHAYPNPFRAQDGLSGMTFCNLPIDAKLTIATVSGGIVRTVDDVGATSEWIWDTRNDNGDNVVSGVYLFHVSYNGGSSSGKVMVIR